MQKKLDEATYEFSQALKLNPNYKEALSYRMDNYCNLKKYEKALEDALRLQKLQPDYPDIDYTISQLMKFLSGNKTKL